MSPKLNGALQLLRTTRAAPLDRIAMFSSVSSFIGSAGQGNYAASNFTLDNMASWLRTSGYIGTFPRFYIMQIRDGLGLDAN